MYLRLKQDVLRDKHRTRMLRVEVLEAYRCDRLNGEPRNRLVFYAGSIPEYGLNLPDYQFRAIIYLTNQVNHANLFA